MYAEPFKFHFRKGVRYSVRMEHLADLFRKIEGQKIDPINFCGLTISNDKGVRFTSSHPELTAFVVLWLKAEIEAGVLVVTEPKYLENA